MPTTTLLRRLDIVEVIGAALLARATGLRHRRIAAALGRPSVAQGDLRPCSAADRTPMLGAEEQEMYRKILFAVDDDEALPAAIPVVAGYARRWNASVHVLHVDQHRREENGGAPRLVESVLDRLHEEGVRAVGELRPLAHGEGVATAIASTAGREEADLVVVGSHGRSDLGALLRGSVSHAVAAGLDVPVLVVRSTGTAALEPRTVLVAVDGSRASDDAVEEAAELAASFGGRVVVTHVHQLVAVPSAAIPVPAEEALGIIRRARVAVQARGVPASAETIDDLSVGPALAQAAERAAADLVVLGSRRPSDAGGLLLGSVAHEVIHLVRCPVLLARRHTGRGAVR